MLDVSRERLEKLARAKAELRNRQERKLQSHRGWYDKDGVRQGGLMAFIRYYWRILEPEAELIEGWALWAIVEHLEAVSFGEIKRLLITVPPGFMKSLCTDVFWPAWLWGPMNQAHKRFVAFSYSASLTERDNERFRDLIIHQSYQELWRDRVTPVKVGATKITNTRKGWKLASSVGGVGTGERGDCVILDDAHNIKEAESEIVRTDTVRWFRESMSDRLNSMENGWIVVIMQRANEDDVAGSILTLGLPYCHLMIPMEFDWSRQVDERGEPIATDIGWIDPRYVSMAPEECDGALAWVERFPPDTVEQIKAVKGPYAYAGQYQQAPAPRGGGIFKTEWWQVWESTDGRFPIFDLVLASVDSAFTTNEQNDPTGMTVWGVFSLEGKRRLMLVNAWRKHLAFSGPRVAYEPGETKAQWQRRTQPTWGLMEWVQYTCERFKVDKLLIEGKASGISAAQELRNRYGRQDWSTQICPVKGDKVARALGVQATFSQLGVYAPVRDWSDMVIQEMAVFPAGKYDDLTDSATQAVKFLRDTGMAPTDEEVLHEEQERVTHHGRPKAPLYPI